MALLIAGCVADLEPRECTRDTDCLQGGSGGYCLPSVGGSSKMWCAFTAPTGSCATDLRWGILAGDNLAGTCVSSLALDGGVADAPLGSSDAGVSVDAGAADAAQTSDAGGTIDAPAVMADAPPMVDARMSFDAATPDAVAPGALSIDPPTITFSAVTVGMSTTTTVTVRNTGGVTLSSIGTTLTGANSGDFSFDTNNCAGKDLGGGTGCTLVVRFHPGAGGERDASLLVSSTSGANTTASISGTGRTHLTINIDARWCNGSVSSLGNEIHCGQGVSSQICDADFTTATVELTAQAGTRPEGPCYFDTWSVAACGSAGTCDVVLQSSQTVTASFSPRSCVDPNLGNDAGRGSCSAPYKTIAHALAATASGDIVQIKPGIYSADANGETFPLNVPQGVIVIGNEAVKGAGASTTSVSGVGPVASCQTMNVASGATVAGLQLTAPGSLTGCAAIEVEADDVTIRNNTLVGNGGQGISATFCKRMAVIGNHIHGYQTGLYSNRSDLLFQGNQVTSNSENGVYLFVKQAGDPSPDVGGGSRGSTGNNTFSCNSVVDLFLDVDSSFNIAAENNVWDHTDPSVGCSAGADVCNLNAAMFSVLGATQIATGACP